MADDKPKHKKRVYKPSSKASKAKDKQVKEEQLRLLKQTDEDGEILIPPQVTDKEAYLEYIRLQEKLTTDKDYYFQTSDPELIINTMSNAGRIEEVTRHLPPEEVQKILTIATRLRKISSKAAFLRKKSFGLQRQGGNSQLIEVTYKRDHKLFYAERGSEVLEYFGRYFTIAEVHRIVTQEWLYPININTLKQYRVDNIDKITERQEEFKREIGDIRLGHKRSRLEEYSYLFATRRDIYSKSKHRDDSKELRAILEAVRKEVEGDTLTINGQLNINHELRIQTQINDQLMKGLNLKAFILASVSAKLGMDPVVLQHKLINSYYAKFTGFKPADNDLLADQIIYPSQLIYDFDMIKVENSKLIAEEAELVEALTPTISAADNDKVMDIKTMVLKKLMENKAMNRKTKTVIESKKLKGE